MLAYPLALVAGARYTEWSTGGMTSSFSKDKVSSCAGLIYDINDTLSDDINDTLSAYVSYTSIFQPEDNRSIIFQPEDNRSINGNYLAPIEGKNYETGLKSDWLDGRQTASIVLFRIEQDNLAVVTRSMGRAIRLTTVRKV
ncbi:MAG: TonB-dependent receptor domain-containing protein [Symbiopectobacterium sp.]